MKGFIRVNAREGYGSKDSIFLRVSSIVSVQTAPMNSSYGHVTYEAGGATSHIVTLEDRDTLISLMEEASK